MARKRIHELAKDIDMESKTLIEKLQKMGAVVKSHTSAIDNEFVEKIMKEAGKKNTKKKKEDEPVPEVEIVEPVESINDDGTSELRVAKGVIRRRTMPPPPPPVSLPEEKTTTLTEEEKKTATNKAPKVDASKSGLPPVETAPKTELSGETDQQKKYVPLTSSQELKAGDEKIKAETKQGEHSGAAKVPGETGAKPKEKQAEIGAAKGKVVPGMPLDKKALEVFVEDKKFTKKKVFAQKLYEKRDKRGKQSFDDRKERQAAKWREEKAAASGMQKTNITTPKQIKRRVKIAEAIAVSELAKRMGIKASEIIAKLISMGMMLTLNQSMDKDTATLIAAEFGFQVEAAEMEVEESMLPREAVDVSKLKARAPVVTIMGHVDHGKTSLLDAIRKTDVTAGEAGGITQAIGAYHVSISGRDVVFLDTPGHEAFTAMRARGAKVTDIVVIVVAADDGVMEQTVEAINHSRSANVPIMIAINKIDKPEADIDRIKRGLSDYDLMPEDWGGTTVYCEVSAKKRVGIEELLEMILLQADIMELKANPEGEARGIIVESKIDRGRGPVATVLIQEGTVREGDTFVSKAEYGKVRALVDDKGARLKYAGPSMPVEIIGFSNVPQVGSEFACMKDEKRAKSIAEYWLRREREKELLSTSKITLEQLYQKMLEGVKELNVIIKGDVQGSVEALKDAINKLGTSDIKVKLIHSSTGAVTETDIMLASAADAIIIGFNVSPPAKVMELAQKEGVDVKLYNIIYNVIDDIKAAMTGMLEPIYKDTVLGCADIRQVFKISKIGTIAGCYVTDGKIVRNCSVRLMRGGEKVFEGKLESLKRMKDDAKEVATGYECGISIENYNDIKEGDTIEAYTKEKVERTL